MQKTITISALAAILSLPVWAQITNNATCNTTNLGKSANGDTAQTEAIWSANTININWYNGNTKVSSNTCLYDGKITLPTQPTKAGYTFAGWRLRSASGGNTNNNTDCYSIDDEEMCDNTMNCKWDFDDEECTCDGVLLEGEEEGEQVCVSYSSLSSSDCSDNDGVWVEGRCYRRGYPVSCGDATTQSECENLTDYGDRKPCVWKNNSCIIKYCSYLTEASLCRGTDSEGYRCIGMYDDDDEFTGCSID